MEPPCVQAIQQTIPRQSCIPIEQKYMHPGKWNSLKRHGLQKTSKGEGLGGRLQTLRKFRSGNARDSAPRGSNLLEPGETTNCPRRLHNDTRPWAYASNDSRSAACSNCRWLNRFARAPPFLAGRVLFIGPPLPPGPSIARWSLFDRRASLVR